MKVVGGMKKWERLNSYGPKFVENIVQATARDLLCYSMQTLRCCSIVMHIHDEVGSLKLTAECLCKRYDQMGRVPPGHGPHCALTVMKQIFIKRLILSLKRVFAFH